jgi:peptide/nickel transport system ATP-binding protein/oligopeptide transport system ATP-binding protein
VLSVHELVTEFVVQRSLLGRPLAKVRAVDGVSLDLMPGETLAIVGESGCGKSTLGRAVARLHDPTEGRVVIQGQDIAGLSDRGFKPLRRQVQMIFQDPFASLNPRMSVGQTVAEPLMLHDLVPASGRPARVRALLEAVGLSEAHATRYPHELSGGQRQRVVIARALASEPRVIVCDEAVSALDVSIRSQILNLLKDLQRRLGLSYIFISHDLAAVRHLAHRVAVMYLGRIIEIGTAAEVFSEPRHPYTRALLAAIPSVGPPARGRRAMVEGDLPSPMNPPPGCHFHPRCPYAQDVCTRQRPPLDVHGSEHPAACHFWPTLPAFERPKGPAQTDPRLKTLFDAFTASATEAEAAHA